MHITTTVITHTELTHYLQQVTPSISYYETAAGIVEIWKIPQGIYKAVFVESSSSTPETIPSTLHLLLVGSPFAVRIWQTLLTIATGTTASYKDIAYKVHQPTAWRAAALAIASNNIAYFIPCHRIIGSSGTLRGYRWGLERKKILLQSEQCS